MTKLRYAFAASIAFMALLGPAVSYGSDNADAVLTAVEEADRVVVKLGDAVVTEYLLRPEQKYPYFYPVNGPLTGKSVTTESSEPYPHHHSLFFGCDRVNGGNYWQDVNTRGQIVSRGIRILEAQGDRVVFKNRCRWVRDGAESPFMDERTITVQAPSPTLRVIDFEITVRALMDVQIQKTNHSLFSARMVPELSVTSGGTLVNADGYTKESGTFGMRSPWCHYYGTRRGPGGQVVEGLAILVHPENRNTTPQWFTRDYGFFSPTPLFWIEDAITVEKGQRSTMQYRVLVHGGELSADYINNALRNWSRE